MVEKEARRAVAHILSEAANNYPPSSRAKLPLHNGWGAVISLNFDHAWLSPGAKLDQKNTKQTWNDKPHILSREFERLTANFVIKDAQSQSQTKQRVWFPNRTCKLPHTIRMGLDDYGAPHAVQGAYNRFKQWEREIGITNLQPEQQIQQCANALLKACQGINKFSELNNEPTMPLSWVAEFLYRPIIFAGVGLSDLEIGLWWLLSKRARNTARINNSHSVHILLDGNASKGTWNHHPLGITPIYCQSWDRGWEQVLEKLEQLNGDPARVL